MFKFITLHLTGNDHTPVSMNINAIESFSAEEIRHCCIYFFSGNCIWVTETPEEITALIRTAFYRNTIFP